MKKLISVVGSSRASDTELEVAEEVGREIAQRGWGVVCGGLGGVMEAVCRGASEKGGLTVGILPTLNSGHANPHVEVVIPTGMGEARNVIVALSGEGVIVIGGAYGTLTEVSFALKHGKKVVLLNDWDREFLASLGAEPVAANSPAEAVELLI